MKATHTFGLELGTFRMLGWRTYPTELPRLPFALIVCVYFISPTAKCVQIGDNLSPPYVAWNNTVAVDKE